MCAILRGLKVNLGFNYKTRLNAFFAATVIGVHTRPYAAKGQARFVQRKPMWPWLTHGTWSWIVSVKKLPESNTINGSDQ